MIRNRALVYQPIIVGLDSLTYRKHAMYEENVDREEQPLCFSHYNFECCESFKFPCPNDGCRHVFLVRECVIQNVRS